MLFRSRPQCWVLFVAGSAVTAVLSALTLIIFLTPAKPESRDLEFAYIGGNLYSSHPNGVEDRSEHSLYFLLGLTHQTPTLPDMRGVLANVGEDSRAEYADFNFWRIPGDSESLLLPDHDWTGWAYAWIAPHTAVIDALQASWVDWSARAAKVYWTGALMEHPIRMQFNQCSSDQPEKVFAELINWKQWRSDAFANAVDGKAQKPRQADLRKLLNYKYIIYIPGKTWSSSFKRIISAGAAVFVPSVLQHESITDIILRDCQDCFLYYDIENVCSSILNVLNSKTDNELKRYADRLNSFVKNRVNYEAVVASALDQLTRHASTSQAVAGAVVTNGKTLKRVTCAWVKKVHAARMPKVLAWQIDEWLDDDCKLKPSGYLADKPV
jgi:Glycosyl transferase family 90